MKYPQIHHLSALKPSSLSSSGDRERGIGPRSDTAHGVVLVSCVPMLAEPDGEATGAWEGKRRVGGLGT